MVGTDPHDDQVVSPGTGAAPDGGDYGILAAVMRTFVMDIGNDPQRNIQAGVNTNTNASAEEMNVTDTTNRNANQTEVRAVDATGGSGTAGLGEIGDEVVFTETCAELRGSAWNVSGDGPSGGYSATRPTST